MTHEDDGAAPDAGGDASADAARDAAPNTRRDATKGAETGVSPDGARSDRLERHPTPGPRNSLWSWPEAKSPLVVVRNYVVIVLARICPSLRLKNWLLGRIGVTVGAGVAWGLESTPDVFWPERITVGDDAIVGYDATLLCHEFLREEYRLGDVVVGEGAMIGAGAVVLPGVTIGEGARVAANSLVDADVPPETTVAGVPAEVVSRADGDAGEESESGEESDAGGAENSAGTGETTD